jgi:large subunit ribosomal protein L25
MDIINLQAKIREFVGKKVSLLRKQDIIPGILYGKSITPQNISVDLKEFSKIFKQAGDNTVVDLHIDGSKETHKVLIQKVDYTPTRDRMVHVELLAISLTDKVKVEIPVVLINTEIAEKMGGNLILNLDEIQVEALPTHLPHQIEVDCSVLTDFGQTIYVKDLKLGNDIKILEELESPIVSFDAPEKEEVIEEKPTAEVATVVADEKKEGEPAK